MAQSNTAGEEADDVTSVDLDKLIHHMTGQIASWCGASMGLAIAMPGDLLKQMLKPKRMLQIYRRVVGSCSTSLHLHPMS